MLKGILVVSGVLVVISVEKIPAVMHDTMKVRIGEGIIFGLPFLVLMVLVLWLEARARAKAAAAAAPTSRPGYGGFGQSGTRRRP